MAHRFCVSSGAFCHPIGFNRCNRAVGHVVTCQASQGGDEEGTPAAINRLASTIRRKQQQLGAVLEELGPENLDERLQNATKVPAQPPHRFATQVQETTLKGFPALVLEVVRPSTASDVGEVVELAQKYIEAGADALCVRTDSSDTPSGLKDLFSVCQSSKVPVLARDWYIHPLQIVEAKEAGACGMVGVIASVSSRGTPVMSSFAAALGVDAPVEVVNAQEADAMGQVGVPMFAINVSVGLSISIPGLASDIVEGVLERLPFGALTLVGVKTVEEARKARASGADALLLKEELLAPCEGNVKELMDRIKYATSGDD